MMDKLNKLRQGQEIDLVFLNSFISKVNEIIDKFNIIEQTSTSNDETINGLKESLAELNDALHEKLDSVPNFIELVAQYAALENNFTFTDNKNPTDSPLYEEKTLKFIVTDNIAKYITGEEAINEKTIIFELNKAVINYKFVDADINSQADFEAFQGELYIASDGLYAVASTFEEGITYYKKVEATETVKANRLWFYYDGEFYNLSTDSNGHTFIQTVPVITWDGEPGSETWRVGGVDTHIQLRGPKGDEGPVGPQGPKGDQGLRGATGLTGREGRPGQDGKNVLVKIASCDTPGVPEGFVEDDFVSGKKYIAFKFYYEGDNDDVIRAKPWHYVKIAGETYYPHLSTDRTKLYFTTEPPTNLDYVEGYSVKGDKGDTGATGPAPIIKFVDNNGVVVKTPNSVANDGISQYFSLADFKGPKGDNGTSIQIQGSVNSYADLANVSNASVGDGYIVATDETRNGLEGVLYMYGSSNAWVYCGQVKGPKGDQGIAGTVDATASFEISSEPGVKVTNDGSETNALFNFKFKLPEGTVGDRGTSIFYSESSASQLNNTAVMSPYKTGDMLISSDYYLFNAENIGNVSVWKQKQPLVKRGNRIYVFDEGSITATTYLENNFSNPQGDDVAISTKTGIVWQYRNNSWVDTGNITGPQGERGQEGPQGPQGPEGPQGIISGNDAYIYVNTFGLSWYKDGNRSDNWPGADKFTNSISVRNPFDRQMSGQNHRTVIKTGRIVEGYLTIVEPLNSDYCDDYWFCLDYGTLLGLNTTYCKVLDFSVAPISSKSQGAPMTFQVYGQTSTFKPGGNNYNYDNKIYFCNHTGNPCGMMIHIKVLLDN